MNKQEKSKIQKHYTDISGMLLWSILIIILFILIKIY